MCMTSPSRILANSRPCPINSKPCPKQTEVTMTEEIDTCSGNRGSWNRADSLGSHECPMSP